MEYSNNVTMLIDGYSFDELVADKRTYYSVIKNVEIVGEAAFMLTSDFKKSHPEIPWKVVQGMRHVLVHDYATIDPKELYNTAVNDMKPLRQQVERIISETDWNEWASVPDNGDITDDSNLITIARRMKADGMSVELISKYTGLTAKKINSL